MLTGLVRVSTAVLLLLAMLSEAAASATSDCYDAWDACVKACPNNLSNACLIACGNTLNKVCLAEVKEVERQEWFAKQCSSLSEDPKHYQIRSENTWRTQLGRLRDREAMLLAIRDQLKDDFDWTVGTEGGWRESVTKLAAVTKLTADLITNLSGFDSGDVNHLYELIKAGKLADDAVRKSSEEGLVGIMLEFGSKLHPAVKGLKALTRFTENAVTIAELPENIEKARQTFNEQAALLQVALADLESEMDSLRAEHANELGDFLYEQALDAKKQCQAN